MLRNTDRFLKKKNGFTLVEIMMVAVIALYSLSGGWSVYTMSRLWWNKTAPVSEAESAARTALAYIVQGFDHTVNIGSGTYHIAGTDTVGYHDYPRRNGIAWAVYRPEIVEDADRNPNKIRFGLQFDRERLGGEETHNTRSFYLGGDRKIYFTYPVYEGGTYTENTSSLKLPVGISELEFRAVDYNLIEVTVAVNMYVDRFTGKRFYTIPEGVPEENMKPIALKYTDTVYLRNVR